MTNPHLQILASYDEIASIGQHFPQQLLDELNAVGPLGPRVSITVRASVPFAKLATWTGPCPWPSVPPPGTEFYCCGEWGGDQITRVDYTLQPVDGGPAVGLDIRTSTQDLEYLEHLRDAHGFELI